VREELVVDDCVRAHRVHQPLGHRLAHLERPQPDPLRKVVGGGVAALSGVDELPVAQHEKVVEEREGARSRRVDGRDDGAALRGEEGHDCAHLVRHRRVEAGRWLIEEEDGRPRDEREADVDTPAARGRC